MIRLFSKKLIFHAFLFLACLALPAKTLEAFAYISALGSSKDGLVMHPEGYTGTQTQLTITVGIDPSSPFASEMAIPAQNVIDVWNGLFPTTGNAIPYYRNSGLAINEIDFESVLLHEMGHALGLTHPNIGSEVPDPDNGNYTMARKGFNFAYDFDSGNDGIIGSADDERGDDENINWFPVASNNPFEIASVVDGSTYSPDLEDLPPGDLFSTNADRTVASAIFDLGFTEAVMQQGTFSGEVQRTLGHDDVAGIRMGMSGLDETANTGDDYTINLVYSGLTSTADIVMQFDDSKTVFAKTNTTFTRIGNALSKHFRLTSAGIFFNAQNADWVFNEVRYDPLYGDLDGSGVIDDADLNIFLSSFGQEGYHQPQLELLLHNFGLTVGSTATQSVPEPASGWLMVTGLAVILTARRRRARG